LTKVFDVGPVYLKHMF